MKQNLFISRMELAEMLPWSKNIVSKMIDAGIFRAVRNPVAKKHAKMFFFRPQVESALAGLIGETCSPAK